MELSQDESFHSPARQVALLKLHSFGLNERNLIRIIPVPTTGILS
jgi:hypothetical protein